jgi:hypothetical protein
MQEDIGLSVFKNSDILWSLKSNTELTFYERIRRRLILQEVATVLRLPMSRNTAELTQLLYSIKYNRQNIDSYFPDTPIELYDDRLNLTEHDKVLMPPDVYERVAKHLNENKDVRPQILDKHQNINDDIKFDNQSYLDLRNLLLEVIQK